MVSCSNRQCYFPTACLLTLAHSTPSVPAIDVSVSHVCFTEVREYTDEPCGSLHPPPSRRAKNDHLPSHPSSIIHLPESPSPSPSPSPNLPPPRQRKTQHEHLAGIATHPARLQYQIRLYFSPHQPLPVATQRWRTWHAPRLVQSDASPPSQTLWNTSPGQTALIDEFCATCGKLDNREFSLLSWSSPPRYGFEWRSPISLQPTASGRYTHASSEQYEEENCNLQ